MGSRFTVKGLRFVGLWGSSKTKNWDPSMGPESWGPYIPAIYPINPIQAGPSGPIFRAQEAGRAPFQ